MRRAGFTLIEFLIALVIIGFIVAILVNFFTNPVKEASVSSQAQRVLSAMNSLDDSLQKYRITWPDRGKAGDFLTYGALRTALIRDGGLTAFPLPPTAALVAGHTTEKYGFVSFSSWGDGGLPDYNLELKWVSDDVCKEINRQLGLGAIIPVGLAATAGVDPDPAYGPKQCYLRGGLYNYVAYVVITDNPSAYVN